MSSGTICGSLFRDSNKKKKKKKEERKEKIRKENQQNSPNLKYAYTRPVKRKRKVGNRERLPRRNLSLEDKTLLNYLVRR